MNLIRDINEMAVGMNLSADHRDVAQRLANFWRERAVGMSDDELSEAIAIDLENVAGADDPAIIEKLVPVVMSMVRGG